MGEPYVFLRWKGQKSVVDHPKVLEGIRTGRIDEDDVWESERRRVPGMPYANMRLMGSQNHMGAETETRLERTYKWGPEPWEFVQKVLASDARIILASSSKHEFELVRAKDLQEAQDIVFELLWVAHDHDVDYDHDFVMGGMLLDSLDTSGTEFEKLKRPIDRSRR